MLPQTAAEARRAIMPTPLASPWLGASVGVVQQLIQELGAVCHDLREAAGLDIDHDMRFYTRADARTIKAFEAGGSKTRIADALVDGYAAALNREPSEIGQLAWNRVMAKTDDHFPP